MEEAVDYHVAEYIAHDAGAEGPIYWVKDKWGGYWQTYTRYGVYTFRTR